MNGFSQNLVRFAFVGLYVIIGFAMPVGAAREEPPGSIQQMMTPEEFKAAGLNKLSPEELQKLDAWMQGYRQVAEQAGEKKGSARAERTKMDGVEGKGFFAIANRLLELLHEVVRRGPLVIRLSKIWGHLDHVSKNAYGLFESATLHSHNTVL